MPEFRDPVWSPPEWLYPYFPLTGPEDECLSMETIVAVLHARIDTITENDTSPLGSVLHVAHLLKSEQGTDGRWPEIVNARTGQAVGAGRTIVPVSVLRRLDALHNSSEFVIVCEQAEASRP
jgi:hypothetical protein